jgi:hypothetical protein
VTPLSFHPRSPAARALALVLLVFGWGMPLAFPHLADDDLLCVVEGPGGGDGASVAAAAAPAAADHCAVCHLQRSFRSGDLSGRHHAVALASAPLRLPAPSEHRLQPARLRLPARAPPH